MSAAAMIAEMLYDPTTEPSSTRPNSRAMPPPTVISRPIWAPRRTSAYSCLWPTSRYELIEVSSQNTKSVRMFSASTSPSMAPIKMKSAM